MPKHNMSKGEEGVSINLLGFNFSLNHFFLGKRHEYELKTVLHLNVHQAFIVELLLRGVFSSQSFGLASKLALASPPLPCLLAELKLAAKPFPPDFHLALLVPTGRFGAGRN